MGRQVLTRTMCPLISPPQPRVFTEPMIPFRVDVRPVLGPAVPAGPDFPVVGRQCLAQQMTLASV